MSSTAFGIVLGILVGLRHAFEPDHLTAVSTLVSESHSTRQGVWLGAMWGLGHTISLVVVGVVLTVIGATLPERVGVAFELGVAAMLMLLGARAIVIAFRTPEHAHTHPHAPFHVHTSIRTLRRDRRRWRPLAVGLLHGLAGSGALTALVFTQLPGTAARIIYMTLFGLGSVFGMAIASGLAGAALQLAARSDSIRQKIGFATGVVSIAVGLLWGIPLLL